MRVSETERCERSLTAVTAEVVEDYDDGRLQATDEIAGGRIVQKPPVQAENIDPFNELVQLLHRNIGGNEQKVE